MSAPTYSVLEQAPAHVRAILAATHETLALLFDAEPAFGEPRVAPAQRPRSSEVNVIVGFTGAVQGQLLLGMSVEAACKMASGLLMEELTGWGEMTASGMAEVANIVAGGCATSLHQKGWPSNIGVPSVIVGEQVQISWPNLYVLETTLEVPLGTIELAVGLKVTAGQAG